MNLSSMNTKSPNLELHLKEVLQQNDLSFNNHFLLAVSGGVDSMVLLHLFHELNLSFEVAHCNFNLRGEDSKKDALLVRKFCSSRNIPFQEKNFTISSEENTQIKARELRYRWFQEIVEDRILVLAHHADDQVETLLLNLIRGTGLNGISAMETLNKNQAGIYFRPFLSLRKSDLYNYAETHQVPFREDASNEKNEYSRNKLRNQVIPLLEEVKNTAVSSIINNIEEFQLLRQFIEGQVKSFRPEQRWGMDFIPFTKLPKDDYLRLYFFRNYGFGRQQLTSLKQIESLEVGKEIRSISHEILIDREGIFLRSIEKEKEDVMKIPLNLNEPTFKWAGLSFKTPQNLEKDSTYYIRSWKAGERVKIKGTGSKKIKDLLTDWKIPKWIKKNYPVVVDEFDEVVDLVHGS